MYLAEEGLVEVLSRHDTSAHLGADRGRGPAERLDYSAEVEEHLYRDPVSSV